MSKKSIAICTATVLFLIYAFSSAPPNSPFGHTNAPGEANCTRCHSGTLNGGLGGVFLTASNTTYMPNTTYTITVNVADVTKIRFGFQTTVLDGANNFAGTFTLLNTTNTSLNSNSGRFYVGHKNANSNNNWQFEWTSPANSVGPVTFYFTGNAANGNGSNSGDNIYSGTFVMNPAPVPPVLQVDTTNVTCSGGSDGAVTLTVSGGSPPYVYQWNTAATSMNLTGLTSGLYSVTVTDANASTVSGSAFVAEPAPIILSTVVTHESAPGNNDGSIDVTSSGGVAPYTFLWSDGETTEDIINLSPGVYCVTVTDANNCNASICDTVDAAVIACPDVDSTWTEKITARTARLRWNLVPGAAGYQIQGRLVGSGFTKTITIANGSLNFKDVFGLGNNSTFEWQIRAFCNGGADTSGFTPLITFTTGCFTPANPTTTNIEVFSASLNWEKVQGSEGYEYRYRVVGSSTWTIVTVTGNNTITDSIGGLSPATQYEWKVKTICKQSNNVVSANTASTFFGTLPSRWGVEEVMGPQLMKVFPNPLSSFARVEFHNPDNKNYTMQLKNISGATVQMQSNITDETLVIRKENLSPGMYMLELRGEKLYRKKIMIQ